MNLSSMKMERVQFILLYRRAYLPAGAEAGSSSHIKSSRDFVGEYADKPRQDSKSCERAFPYPKKVNPTGWHSFCISCLTAEYAGRCTGIGYTGVLSR
jgi:hypothetical protein